MSAAQPVDAHTNQRWWDAPVPARRVELVRVATFVYAAVWLMIRVGYFWDLAQMPIRRFEPVGLLARLGAPAGRSALMAVWAVGLLACAFAASGRAVRVTAPVGAVAMLVLATYSSSFGQVFHTEHLLVLHLLILAVWVLFERSDRRATVSSWPLDLMGAVVVVTYVLAGIAKLRFSGIDWVTGDVLRNWVAADNLRKILVGDVHSPLGGWLAGVEWVWLPIAVLTLVVELGAPFALRPGHLRYVWVGLAWAFHVGVLALMAILFPYQLVGVAYLAFLPVERIETKVLGWRRRRRAATNNPVSRRRSGSMS